mgnify:CR=1 FL=1
MKDLFTGEQLAIAGAELAIENANNQHTNWSEKAFKMLQRYLQTFEAGYEFLAEQARLFAEANGLPEPPSKRAWGGIIIRAAKLNLIESTGKTRKVSNSRAHATPANLWRVK